jgi:tRNA(fMet)-specific endonuclease VapC
VILVLDTSAVSALMRREERVLARIRDLRPGDLVLCSPVAAEIQFGLARLPEGSRRRVLLEAEYARLRAVVPWSDWTEAAAAAFGSQKAILERAGTPVGDMDIAIGSVALSLGAAVATANARDFRRLQGLQVEDWGGA